MGKRSATAIDCASNKKKVWLVKVPKYVSDEWQKRGPGGEVGRLKVLANQDVVFESQLQPPPPPAPTTSRAANIKSHGRMGAMALGKKPPASADMPREHRFIVSDLGPQTLAVYSEDLTGLEDPTQTSGKLAMEGKIVKKAELRPPSNLSYLKMKARQFEEAAKPSQSVVQVDRVNKFKPVTSHKEDIMRQKIKKSGENKNIRMERDKMMNALFAAFEKHQYYKLQDLAAVLAQPQSYVKEILNEVGSYNMVPPHRNMWELKEEYRHYSKSDS